MKKTERIYVAGHKGMVGSAIMRCLNRNGYNEIVVRTHSELDLTNQSAVYSFFSEEKIDYVVLAAAKVGGIMANIESPAEFMYENLQIQNNVIHASYINNVKKLLFLGSSCIYPRLAPQPMKEEYLLDGKVEPTNEGYALAKIAGLKMCQMYNRQYGTNYISVMPCNLYGIGDNFDRNGSHVVPGLIRKFHEAKVQKLLGVTVWGTGKARRELLFADDLAEACVYLMETYSGDEFLNIGTGNDVSIRELAEIIKSIVGFTGKIRYDSSKPDGMPQKVMDVSRIKEYGWLSRTSLYQGIEKTYQWYIEHECKI